MPPRAGAGPPPAPPPPPPPPPRESPLEACPPELLFSILCRLPDPGPLAAASRRLAAAAAAAAPRWLATAAGGGAAAVPERPAAYLALTWRRAAGRAPGEVADLAAGLAGGGSGPAAAAADGEEGAARARGAARPLWRRRRRRRRRGGVEGSGGGGPSSESDSEEPWSSDASGDDGAGDAATAGGPARWAFDEAAPAGLCAAWRRAARGAEPPPGAPGTSGSGDAGADAAARRLWGLCPCPGLLLLPYAAAGSHHALALAALRLLPPRGASVLPAGAPRVDRSVPVAWAAAAALRRAAADAARPGRGSGAAGDGRPDEPRRALLAALLAELPPAARRGLLAAAVEHGPAALAALLEADPALDNWK
jgi:hypothetical protein